MGEPNNTIQTLEITTKILIRCFVINVILMFLWVAFLFVLQDFMFMIHHEWFGISKEQFVFIHYSGLLVYKLCILFFNLLPFFAIKMVLKQMAPPEDI